jgi:hypothetical protein
LADHDEAADLTLMTGRFMLLISPDHTYWATFTPGLSDELAVTVPVFERSTMVDLIAIRADDMDCWGVVTGRGGIIVRPMAGVRD